MSEILAAIFGALLAGGLQTIVGICDRRRETESVLVAIASEVDSLCRLIRHRGYHDGILEVADLIKKEKWDGQSLIVDIRSDYFSVFNALSPRIGLLEPGHAALIVNFYAY